ncbi:MAG: hypothetical protein Aurels2KO_24550 [Aureliella sp.]
MGDLLFKIPPSQKVSADVWDTAYITGIEGIPWKCHYRVDGDQFSIGREIDESGKLNIVWPTETFGPVSLATTSLRISNEPYSLIVELARGTVDRLRGQTAEWQRIGLRIPEDFFPLAERTLADFLQAVTGSANTDQQAALSQRAIESALAASVQLCDTYSNQALEARRNSEGRLSTLQGIQLGRHDISSVKKSLSGTFNLINVTPDLGSVESQSGKSELASFDEQVNWAQREGKKICIGPLVDFRKGGLPKWMILLDEGFESIQTAACKHAQACVDRFMGKAHIWNCLAGLNIPGDISWSDEETLRLAVSIIETVRQADQRSPVLLTIDQPWSEYLRKDDNGISPINFADALIRADLGLSGLALDLHFGQPDFPYFRDPIELSRLIDRWSMLGLPLLIQLSLPSSPNPEGKLQFTPETMLNLLLSKPCVHAVTWKTILDSPQEDQQNGLWDSKGKPKPLLRNMADTRARFLH